MFAYLKSHIESKAPVEMIYQSSNGTITHRIITHRIITIYEISDKYIKAYCHLRKKFRIFRRDNILSIYPYKQLRKYIS